MGNLKWFEMINLSSELENLNHLHSNGVSPDRIKITLESIDDDYTISHVYYLHNEELPEIPE